MDKKKPRSYTDDFRRSSAKLAVESDQPVLTTAQELGVHVVTLHGWIKRYYPSGKSSSKLNDMPDALAEIKRLKKEVARLRMERDILKKATAYFASDNV